MHFIQVRNKNKKAGKYPLLLLLTGIVLFSVSCVTNRQAVYVQPGKDQKIDFEAYINAPRTIKSGDELYIRVNSEREETNIFSQWGNIPMVQQDITLATYHVNQDGSVRFPIVGTINLKGLTLAEASSVIEKTLIGIVNNPIVTVKFVNKTVTVLGEVNAPGRYDYPDQEINIFQALGYAGDIAYYGNRKKVMIIRKENNVIKRNYIDLTDENLLESNFYTLRPNDIIYVEPLKRRLWGFQAFPWGIAMGLVSTTLVILSFIQLNAH